MLLACALVVFSTLYPIYFVLIASISDSGAVATGQVVMLPKRLSLFGYEQILGDARIWAGCRNTIVYTAVGTALNLAVTLPAAFALSRREFRPRRPLMLFFAFTMFFSGGLIPTYLLYKDRGLLDNWLVFILPSAVNVYNLIIARSLFENSLPDELYEAATLDGADYFRFFATMALPLSKAIISVIGLYYLVQHWNDFFTGLIFVRDYAKQPLQIVLRDILLSNQAFSGGVNLGAAPATMALNAIIRRYLLNQALETRDLVVAERPGLWREFWRVWRQEFWRAQAIGAVALAGWAVFGLDRLVLRGGVGEATPWLSGLVVVLSVLWAAATLIVWPVAVRFGEPLPRVAKLVVVLALSRPAHSLAVLVIVAGWLWLWRACPGLIPVFGVALPAWCVSWLYWHSGVLPLPESAVPYDQPDDVDVAAAIWSLADR